MHYYLRPLLGSIMHMVTNVLRQSGIKTNFFILLDKKKGLSHLDTTQGKFSGIYKLIATCTFWSLSNVLLDQSHPQSPRYPCPAERETMNSGIKQF